MGAFHDAYASYNAIEEPDEEVQDLVENARLRSLLLSAREHVHVNEVSDALMILDAVEAEYPGMSATTSIREFAYQRKAASLARSAEQLMDDGYPESAEKTFEEALRWDPMNAVAQRGKRESSRLAEARGVRGESLYFEGLSQVLEGDRGQARTSFQAAAQLLGDESRAQEQYTSLSRELAAEQVVAAMLWLDRGDIGGAWLLLSDAVRLDPENLDAISLYAQVDQELQSRRLLGEADIHVRGGRIDAAEALLQRVIEITGETTPAVAKVADQAVQERARRDYQLGRACELDNQVVRAVRIYEEILRQTEGYGYEDLSLRMDNLRKRVELAAESYTIAMDAERAGDQDAYALALGQVIDLAADYEDALQRYKAIARP